ncbi:MAG: MBL fold metallo-hydrolase [Bacteriovoracaceae bacterium]
MFFFLSLLISLHAEADINFQWLGITGFSLSDGKTTLLFDPVITRPSLFDILFRRSIKSDPTLVDAWIKQAKLTKVDATFVTHSHHDHSLDMPEFAKKLGGHVYGSPSTITIARNFGVNEEELKPIKEDQVIQVGDFKITVVQNEHVSILGPLYFAKGEVEKKEMNKDSSVFDYKMGDSFGYFIEHPEGKIVFQATSKVPPKYQQNGFPASVVLLSVAKIDGIEHLLSKVISMYKPHTIVPLHFDNFFKPIIDNKVEYLFGVNMDQFKKVVVQLSPNMKVIEPKYTTPIRLY